MTRATAAAARLLAAWSEVCRCPRITELQPGRLWEVRTEPGDRFVLKKVSTFNAPDPARRFSDEAHILTHLSQRGLPVAAPLPANDGRAYTTDAAGAPHALFPMLASGGADDDPGLDAALFQNIGAAIARLHVALASCPFAIDSWEVGPDVLQPVWQRVSDRLAPATLSELSARVGPRWESMIQALSAPLQRVHGDVHGGNILTVGRRVTGIIDTDHLPLAPRGYDLGYYMAFSVRSRLKGEGHPVPPLARAAPFITRHLLTGYDAVSPLTRQEHDDLPALALFAALALLDFFLQAHDLVEESWLRTVQWVGDHFEAFRLATPAFDE